MEFDGLDGVFLDLANRIAGREATRQRRNLAPPSTRLPVKHRIKVQRPVEAKQRDLIFRVHFQSPFHRVRDGVILPRPDCHRKQFREQAANVPLRGPGRRPRERDSVVQTRHRPSRADWVTNLGGESSRSLVHSETEPPFFGMSAVSVMQRRVTSNQQTVRYNTVF